jgi:hypothetical protein
MLRIREQRVSELETKYQSGLLDEETLAQLREIEWKRKIYLTGATSANPSSLRDHGITATGAAPSSPVCCESPVMLEVSSDIIQGDVSAEDCCLGGSSTGTSVPQLELPGDKLSPDHDVEHAALSDSDQARQRLLVELVLQPPPEAPHGSTSDGSPCDVGLLHPHLVTQENNSFVSDPLSNSLPFAVVRSHAYLHSPLVRAALDDLATISRPDDGVRRVRFVLPTDSTAPPDADVAGAAPASADGMSPTSLQRRHSISGVALLLERRHCNDNGLHEEDDDSN